MAYMIPNMTIITTGGGQTNVAGHDMTVFESANKHATLAITNVRQTKTYGDVTVSSIKRDESVELNGTKVKGSVISGGSVSATNAEVDSNIEAEAEITAIESRIGLEIKAKDSVTANRCETLGAITAGGFVKLDECKNVKSITAVGSVSLLESKVTENVTSKSDVDIKKSIIGATLTCFSNRLIIEDSEIDVIDLRCAGRDGYISMVNKGKMYMSGFQMQPQIQKNDEPQVLELRDCIVKKVIFERENGKVITTGIANEPIVINGRICEF